MNDDEIDMDTRLKLAAMLTGREPVDLFAELMARVAERQRTDPKARIEASRRQRAPRAPKVPPPVDARQADLFQKRSDMAKIQKTIDPDALFPAARMSGPVAVDPRGCTCHRLEVRRPIRGILVAIEGIDGAGKTTQAAVLADRLRSVGLEVVGSKEPTAGPWGQKIRASAATARMPLREELHAFMEDRREHVSNVIAPALTRGAIVLLDRYYFSNAAYQGAQGVNPQTILRENESFAPRPDLLVILNVPVELGLQRIRARGDIANAFERHDTLERSAKIFGEISGEDVLHVDGTKEAEEVTRRILVALYKGALFRALCLKEYKRQCEPEYCSLRDRCGYLQLGSLAPVEAPGWLAIVDDDSLSDEQKIERLVSAGN